MYNRLQKAAHRSRFLFVWNMSVIENIRSLIEPSIDHMGYELVRARWMGGAEYRTLQLMIEPKSGATTTVEDCEAVSSRVSAILDVEDTVKDAYRLEVSSPGIDRPLTRLKDFERWKGFDTKLETNESIDGRRRFRGKIVAVNDNILEFELGDENKRFNIPFENVSEAKLMLSDELVDYVTKDKTGD